MNREEIEDMIDELDECEFLEDQLELRLQISDAIEKFRDSCNVCDGTGQVSDGYENMGCPSCFFGYDFE